MASRSGIVDERIVHLEREAEFWKARFNELNVKYLDILRTNLAPEKQKVEEMTKTGNSSKDDVAKTQHPVAAIENVENGGHPDNEENEEPVANEANREPVANEEVETDPIKRLQEQNIQQIVNNLHGHDFLTALEISPAWKSYIESTKSLTDKGFENIIFRPEMENFSLSSVVKVFGASTFKRPYRHLITDISHSFSLIPTYASSVETLVLQDKNSKDFLIEPTDFPKLRELVCYLVWDYRFLENLTFPQVTHLKLVINPDPIYQRFFFNSSTITEYDHYYDDHRLLDVSTVVTFVREKFPSLKWLVHENDIYEDMSFTVEMENNEYISFCGGDMMFFSYPCFRSISETLKNLNFFSYVSEAEIKAILARFRQLKSLIVKGTDCSERSYPRNEMIEVFKIDRIVDLSDRFKDLLLAMPSLKTLVVLESKDASLITFAATNLRYLKEFIFKQITKEMRQVYQEVQDNHSEYLNPFFQLLEDPNHIFYDNRPEFQLQ